MIDIQLIEQCKKQNPKAQKELYSILAPKLYGICIKYCKDKNLADDLFQEAFICVFNKVHQFKNKGSFEGWAKRITINTVLQHFKKQQFHQPIVDDLLIDDTEDLNIDHNNIDLSYLLDLINKLPNQYRLVFNLYVLDGYSHKEISEILEITIGTSKSNLSRAKQLLRKKLEVQFPVMIKV